MNKKVSVDRSKEIDIVFRKMEFTFGKDTGKLWANNSPFITYFWTAFSSAFPDGELFFMNSGRYFKDDIKSPELKKQFEKFIRQEAHHTYQHKQMNAMMREQGFDVDKYEGWFAGAIKKIAPKFSRKIQLAASVALEHFTAYFANQYLTESYLTEGFDPEMKALWSWHSVEELEHKGVLYDLYNEIDGDYLTRVVTLPFAWAFLFVITSAALIDMLRQDKKLLNWKDNLKGSVYVARFLLSSIPEFLRYFKPSFHPWDDDNRDLIGLWHKDNKHYIQSAA
ncbi:MAG: metal-dependent hydrolase [Pseudomonadales bacterium]|nr:metal-dependent hydrolase [Pseudomonadales bacterium]